MYQPTGVGYVSQILSRSTSFLVYYDPDIDGAIAGDLTRRFLSAYNQQFMYYINENRKHGLKLTEAQLSQLVGKTIILVDAGMTKAEVEMLTSRGINIINIDHHDIDEEEFVYVKDANTGCEGVIINNQYPQEPDEYRFLSGAGVVYYVVQALSPGLFGKDEEALVGLSLLSDIRPIESQKAGEFLHVTYTHQSPLTDYLIDIASPEVDYGFGVQTFDRNYIDFTFSPKINALFRLNRGDDAIALFEGRFPNKSDLAVYKNVQNSIAKSIVDNLQGEDLSNLVFKFVDSHLPINYNYDITNFIGLACSQVKNAGKTSLLFVRENGAVKRGSVRGLCDDVDYLQLFRDFNFNCAGHKNAFGVNSVDLDRVDLVGLNKAIAELETGYSERKYAGRILDVNNLAFFTEGKYAAYADHNNYVRDQNRIYIRYTGSNYTSFNKGEKAVQFAVDGLKVMAFQMDLTPSNGLILPVRERGSYINFYLRPY